MGYPGDKADESVKQLVVAKTMTGAHATDGALDARVFCETVGEGTEAIQKGHRLMTRRHRRFLSLR